MPFPCEEWLDIFIKMKNGLLSTLCNSNRQRCGQILLDLLIFLFGRIFIILFDTVGYWKSFSTPVNKHESNVFSGITPDFV